MFEVGDIVEFRSTIWRGRRGRISAVTESNFYRVTISGTLSANWTYAQSALKLIKKGSN